MRLPSVVARVSGYPGAFFSKFCSYNKLPIPVLGSLVVVSALTLLARVSSADDAAGRLHLLPFILDGDGVQSRLIITNVSDSASHCSLEFSGPDLGPGRFEDHFLVMANNETAEFELEENGGNLIWSSTGEGNLTYGYARLDCAEPVAARVLFSSSVADELISMTSLSSERKADRFQFTLIPQLGSLALVFANDQDPAASCMAELVSPYGSVLSETSISVPAMTSVFRMADELFRIPEDYTAGAVRVSCGREMAATGFLLKSGLFSVLPPVALAKPVIGISGEAEATEGGDVVFTITANIPPAMDMTVFLTVGETGSYVDAGDLGEKQVILPAGSTSVDYIVATIDDSEDKVDGEVTITINPAEGYMMSEIDDSAQAVVRDNDDPAPVSQSPEPESEPESDPGPEPEPETRPQPRDPQPPSNAEPTLTDFSLTGRASGDFWIFNWHTEPEDAELSNLGLDWEPYNAGSIWDASFYYGNFIFRCRSGYRGNVTIYATSTSGNVTLATTTSFRC